MLSTCSCARRASTLTAETDELIGEYQSASPRRAQLPRT
jgi:hypothetical protein